MVYTKIKLKTKEIITMKNITAYQTKNFKATQNKEHESFIAIKGEKKDQCTDIVFHSNGKIKSIYSELSKDEVKKLFADMVEEFYKEY
jgi:hypothetical protein